MPPTLASTHDVARRSRPAPDSARHFLIHPRVPQAPTLPQFGTAVSLPASLRAVRLPPEYTLSRLVQESRTTEVWKAYDGIGRPVAVKVARTADAAAQARFATEARALAALTHRSIVRMQGHGETADRRPFIALEWLEGTTLADILDDRDAGIPVHDAIRLMMPIGLALLLAHDRGIVHGSVRAEHIVLVQLSRGVLLPRLIDFSGARRLHPTIPPPGVRGKPPRITPAPPFIPADPVVDVRGLAATIFHAIAGTRPFSQASPNTVDAVLPMAPHGLSERDATLWRILAEGLAPPASSRVKSLHDFVRGIAAWADLQGLSSDITGGSIPGRWFGNGAPSSRRGGQRP